MSESRRIESMFVHQAATREDLSRNYLITAGKLFSQGQDNLACYLRDVIVPDLVKEARALRERQENQKKITKELGQPEEITEDGGDSNEPALESQEY